jgi:signal transduction histidine kinase
MLHEFLVQQRAQIVARVRERVAQRRIPLATVQELETGVPLFLDQLAAALVRSPDSVDAIRNTASGHAKDLHEQGFTISQIVHGYGDICQVVTGLAIELDVPMSTTEFRMLNLCLDEAIAGAVTEFSRLREASIVGTGNERIGFLAHEIRNLLNSAVLSFDMLRAGTVPMAGSTGAILGRSLSRLNSLVARSLAEVRLESGVAHDEIVIASILEDMEIVATADAKVRNVLLAVHACSTPSTILGDRLLLGSAIDNLVQNAIKFTPPDGHVTVTERVEGDSVVIDVADECGGLLEGDTDGLFAAFEQRHANRSGLGLGLAIGRKAVRAMGGDITVRNLRGKGCIFSIVLPLATRGTR